MTGYLDLYLDKPLTVNTQFRRLTFLYPLGADPAMHRRDPYEEFTAPRASHVSQR